MKEDKYRILVVDDERDLCEILKFDLETEGHMVETANSAEEAMMMDISSFNLLLLDMMMGEMSGFSMAKKLKENPRTTSIPIILLTVRDTESDTVANFDLDADDYISEPFSTREMLICVRAVIRGTNETDDHTEPKTLKYQGLEMDLDKKTVIIDGENVPFTKAEFELLHLSLFKKGHVFPRRELIDRIWPKDVLVLGHTVDVNITRLKKKIGRFSKCIVTRLGPGYYFDVL